MIITQLVGKFLQLLYGPLSFLYGVISWAVSFGQWNNWGAAVWPYIEGPTILEIGFGPGHLLNRLAASPYRAVGLDASRQMTRAALRRVAGKPCAGTRINRVVIRASSLNIPLPANSFDTIVSTFPAPFLFHPNSLIEIRRVLKPTGRLLILLSVEPRRDTLPGMLLWLLYRLTGETAADPARVDAPLRARFAESGFLASIEHINARHADLLLIKC